MIRRLALLVFVFVLSTGMARAEEIKGVLAKVDTEKSTITINFPPAPGGSLQEDRTIAVPKEAKIVDLGGNPIKDGLKDNRIKELPKRVIVTTEKKDGKELVTKVQILIPAEKR
jgi:hypothetical protein